LGVQFPTEADLIALARAHQSHTLRNVKMNNFSSRIASIFVPAENIGNLGEEIIASLNPTWTRMPVGFKGYDFLNGAEQVQVKTWASSARTHEMIAAGSCHRVIILELCADGTYTILRNVEMVWAPGGPAEVRVGRKAPRRASSKSQ
jgi:hypothetical protein